MYKYIIIRGCEKGIWLKKTTEILRFEIVVEGGKKYLSI